MGTLRSEEGNRRYDALIRGGHLERSCPLCDAPALRKFKTWKLIENAYPYDKIAATHHMMVPLRHTDEHGIAEDEWRELNKIKDDYVHQNYEWMLESTRKKRSVPAHYHMHLIVAKD